MKIRGKEREEGRRLTRLEINRGDSSRKKALDFGWEGMYAIGEMFLRDGGIVESVALALERICGTTVLERKIIQFDYCFANKVSST